MNNHSRNKLEFSTRFTTGVLSSRKLNNCQSFTNLTSQSSRLLEKSPNQNDKILETTPQTLSTSSLSQVRHQVLFTNPKERQKEFDKTLPRKYLQFSPSPHHSVKKKHQYSVESEQSRDDQISQNKSKILSNIEKTKAKIKKINQKIEEIVQVTVQEQEKRKQIENKHRHGKCQKDYKETSTNGLSRNSSDLSTSLKKVDSRKSFKLLNHKHLAASRQSIGSDSKDIQIIRNKSKSQVNIISEPFNILIATNDQDQVQPSKQDKSDSSFDNKNFQKEYLFCGMWPEKDYFTQQKLVHEIKGLSSKRNSTQNESIVQIQSKERTPRSKGSSKKSSKVCSPKQQRMFSQGSPNNEGSTDRHVVFINHSDENNLSFDIHRNCNIFSIEASVQQNQNLKSPRNKLPIESIEEESKGSTFVGNCNKGCYDYREERSKHEATQTVLIKAIELAQLLMEEVQFQDRELAKFRRQQQSNENAEPDKDKNQRNDNEVKYHINNKRRQLFTQGMLEVIQMQQQILGGGRKDTDEENRSQFCQSGLVPSDHQQESHINTIKVINKSKYRRSVDNSKKKNDQSPQSRENELIINSKISQEEEKDQQ